MKKHSKPQIKLNIIDRFALSVSPNWGMNRIRGRAAVASLESSGHIGGPSGPIGPGSPKRSMMNWGVTANTADEDTVPNRIDMIAGSQDLVTNDCLAGAAINRATMKTAGRGLILQSKPDRKFLNLKDDEAAEIEENIEREFELFATSKDANASRELTFNEMQPVALYNTLLSGDMFCLPIHIPRKNGIYDLSIQMIEATKCSNPHYGLNTDKLIEGVEKGKHNEPISYWFVKSMMGGLPTDWKNVKAYGKNGYKQVLHLKDTKRINQTRGDCFLAPIMEDMKQMKRYKDSEIMAALIASFYTVFIKTSTPEMGLSEVFKNNNSGFDTSDESKEADTFDSKHYEMAPGAIINLDENESVDIANPNRPNAQFEAFYMAYVQNVGAVLGIPAEELILSFSKSYSASRAVLLQAWEFYMNKRLWLSINFCQPIYEQWFLEALFKGRIEAPGFFEDPAIAKAWMKAEWVGSGMPQIDPLKEIVASEKRLNSTLTTHEKENISIHGGVGGRWVNTMNQNIREKKLIFEAKQNAGLDKVEEKK